MLPSIWNENLWDEWFGFPELRDMDRAERKLYGRHADRLMKTDVLEHEDQYEVDIDLPGFAKEEIKLELNNGYLTINAEKNLDQNKEKHGKLIRQERYSGSMQRSFYVGEEVTEEDVKASFQHGVLKLLIPKKERKPYPRKRRSRSNNRKTGNSRGISPGCFFRSRVLFDALQQKIENL